MEHCCRAVVGTVEWINKSRTEDVVQIDMGQLWEVGRVVESVWGVCMEVGCGKHDIDLNIWQGMQSGPYPLRVQ